MEIALRASPIYVPFPPNLLGIVAGNSVLIGDYRQEIIDWMSYIIYFKTGDRARAINGGYIPS